MKKAALCALLVIVLGGGSLLTMAWAQQPGAPTRPPAAAPDAPSEPFGPARRPSPPAGGISWGGGRSGGAGRIGAFGGRMGGGGMLHPPMSEEEMQESDALHQAVDKLKSAKSDAEKTSATKEISQLLEKLFQRDLEHREHQVTEIEARVKKLRDQIEKRKKAKDDILTLHLKTIINESEGLGFPGRFDNESGIGPHGRSFHWDAMPELVPPRPPGSE
jgi:hypothetical protein